MIRKALEQDYVKSEELSRLLISPLEIEEMIAVLFFITFFIHTIYIKYSMEWVMA